MTSTQPTDFERSEVDPTKEAVKGLIPLSIVIITENEEDQVRECIESVIEACTSVSAFEVILVDSASTDRTVERAQEYPITILRIPEEHTVSCGAGRYVGGRVAQGERVLHVDGDMTLTETWLSSAIDYMEAHEDVAAIEGCLDHSAQSGVIDVQKVGGVMLYDADALAEIGGFDPYLIGYEDIDVGFQLKTAGYRLVRLPEVSAIHHDDGGMAEPLRRWRQGYYNAPGQTIRKWLASPSILRRLLGRQRFKFALMAWLAVGALSIFSVSFLLMWSVLSVIGFGFLATRLGLREAITFLVAKALGVLGVAVGFAQPAQSTDEYPLSAVEVVSTGRVLEGGEAF